MMPLKTFNMFNCYILIVRILYLQFVARDPSTPTKLFCVICMSAGQTTETC